MRTPKTYTEDMIAGAIAIRLRRVLPLRSIRDHVRRFKRGPQVAICLRDALYALRSVTTWGVYAGRGDGAEREAGLFNRACDVADGAIYDVETELWAIAELDDGEYEEWGKGT